MQLTFGAGEMFAQMVRDAQGNTIVQRTPVRIMGMQEFNLEFSGDLKEYHGQNRYALAVAMGKVKATGKVKGALINGVTLNSLFFASTMTTGTAKAIYADTAGVAAAASVAITPPGSGTYAEDMGVMDSNGRIMTKVASAPAAGQYSVTGSTYSFASADVSAALRVYISYSYTQASASAKKIALDNIAMGTAPSIAVAYQGSFGGKRCLVELNSITSNKLSLFAAKNDDFSVPELDFACSTDDAGFSLGSITVAE